MTGSGDMNRRATFQRATVTFDSFGGEVETWGTLASVWIHRRDASAGESYKAQEVGGNLTMRFRIRYSSTVATLNPRDRVLYNGRVFNITGVREKQRNRWLEVDAVIQPDIQAEQDGSP
jgi:SPP1 family predicted phage head-tail adaptor